MTPIRRWTALVALVLVVTLAAPANAVTEDETLGESTYYVVVAEPGAPIGLYREANGCEGFQGTEGDCDGDGSTEPGDERVDSFTDAWRLAVDAEDEAWERTVELFDRAWAFAVCLFQFAWDTIVTGNGDWCGPP